MRHLEDVLTEIIGSYASHWVHNEYQPGSKDIYITLDGNSQVNFRTMSRLAEVFKTEDISLVPHKPHEEGYRISEVTMEGGHDSEPEKLHLYGCDLSEFT